LFNNIDYMTKKNNLHKFKLYFYLIRNTASQPTE